MKLEEKNDWQEKFELLKKEFDEFTYIVSHDLKAPVRAINNLSVWIEEDLGTAIPEDALHNMNLLRNRAKRLERMIEAMLQYSRAGAATPELLETDLTELVESIRNSMNGTDALQIHVDSTIPAFLTYKDRLRTIITQVIQNTLTFGSADKLSISISVKDIAPYYLFELADNGGGVPETALQKLFNLFYTVAAKDSVDTAGSGLTIAKKLVQLSGGDIWAENNKQGGLSICFTLPKELKTDKHIGAYES